MWGKILGALFGMALAKWPGMLLGLLVGHWFDRSLRSSFENAGGFAALKRESADPQGLFMYSTFAVMGHLAKADGVVTQAHIEKANLFMQQLGLDSAQQQEAQGAFREGKAADFPLLPQLSQLKQAFRWRPDLLQMFLENSDERCLCGCPAQSNRIAIITASCCGVIHFCQPFAVSVGPF